MASLTPCWVFKVDSLNQDSCCELLQRKRVFLTHKCWQIISNQIRNIDQWLWSTLCEPYSAETNKFRAWSNLEIKFPLGNQINRTRKFSKGCIYPLNAVSGSMRGPNNPHLPVFRSLWNILPHCTRISLYDVWKKRWCVMFNIGS